MTAPAVLLYAPDGIQYQRYAGSRGTGLQLTRTAAVAGDGPGASGSDSLQRYPFGTQLILQDGRKYRFALAGGTALVSGNVQQAAANVANHVGLTAIAAGITGTLSRSPTFTTAATAVTADQYAGGYIVVGVTPDVGSVYLINDHAAVASGGGTMTANLAPGNQIRTAWTTDTRVSVIKNPYDAVIVYPTTSTQVHVGVAVSALAAYATTGAALAFGWLQTHGMASVLTNGTVVLGDSVYVAATTAGSVSATTTTFAVAYMRTIGFVARVGATTEHSAIFLTIDG